MNQPILLRPHHGLCIPRFIGKGYSDEFVQKMSNLVLTLKENQNIRVKLVCSYDTLCNSCPNCGCRECTAGTVGLLDEKCLDVCGLSQDAILTWSDYLSIINEKIPTVDMICGDCRWISVCRNFDYEKRTNKKLRGEI